MNKKSNDPYYLLLSERYLRAYSVIHDYEVIQATNRLSLKAAVTDDEKTFLRREMYSGRKLLSSLNRDIRNFYHYREIHNFSPWE